MPALVAHCEDIDAHRRALQDVLESVRRSRSWRYTAPARSLGSRLERLRRLSDDPANL